MSKHRHSKDKMHLTYSELREDKEARQGRKIPFENLPFYCCALSLAPFEDPVCTEQGHVFDILYIMPFIKKYQRNPVTGKQMKANQLIKMHWTHSQNPHAINQFQDPISYKIFTESTHIVCIKTSGFVYAYDTINELCKKTKNYYDLVTNQAFTPADIITIQDPRTDKQRKLRNFDYIKNNLPFVPPEKLNPQINETQTIVRVREQMDQQKKEKREKQEAELEKKRKRKEELQSREDVKGFITWCIENKIYQHQRQTDYTSASLTSTSFTPSITSSMTFRELRSTEIRDRIYLQVKKGKMKGYVQITTNLGSMNFLIHCDYAPRASENFLELSENGYYDNTQFHRLVKNFCLQGGDPTGTGTGGESIFGMQFQDQFNPKLSHNKTGILSMANSGPDQNKSQFFITLAQCKHLDQKHTIFGQITTNDDLLHVINREYCGRAEKPKSPIIIQKIVCFENPFRKVIKKMKDQYEDRKRNKEEEKKWKDKERWLEDKSSTKFSLPFVPKDKKDKGKTESLSDKLLSDYL